MKPGHENRDRPVAAADTVVAAKVASEEATDTRHDVSREEAL
jgi:hypothetical protein